MKAADEQRAMPAETDRLRNRFPSACWNPGDPYGAQVPLARGLESAVGGERGSAPGIFEAGYDRAAEVHGNTAAGAPVAGRQHSPARERVSSLLQCVNAPGTVTAETLTRASRKAGSRRRPKVGTLLPDTVELLQRRPELAEVGVANVLVESLRWGI